MKFLRREVKSDTRGVYVHYGSFRLRPSRPKSTRFKEGEIVSMTEDNFRVNPHYRRIFNDSENYEIWKSKTKY